MRPRGLASQAREELHRLPVGQTADDILGISHWTTTVSTKRWGGIWSGRKEAHKLEYSVVVLVRAAQPAVAKL